MAATFQVKWINHISSDTVKERTGRDWEQWCSLLDRDGCRMMDSSEIAEWLMERYHLPKWWSYTIAAGYAVERGLRQPYEKGRGYGIERVKTIAAPLMKVWAAWRDPAIQRLWLPPVAFEMRRMRYRKSLNLRWPDGSRVCAVFYRGSGKTRVLVTHRTLAERADVERMKVYWADALKRLKTLLTAPSAKHS